MFALSSNITPTEHYRLTGTIREDHADCLLDLWEEYGPHGHKFLFPEITDAEKFCDWLEIIDDKLVRLQHMFNSDDNRQALVMDVIDEVGDLMIEVRRRL